MAGLNINSLSDMRVKVRDWADREDLSDGLIDDFINLACQRANKQLYIAPLEKTEVLSTVGGIVPLPTDYLSTKNLTITVDSRVIKLERKEAGFLEECYSSSSGVPAYFARQNNVLLLAPKPTGSTEVTLTYYKEVDTLEEDGDSNVLLTTGLVNAAVLYGALKELSVYVSDEDTAITWQQQYDVGITTAQESYDEEEWSGGTLSINR
jgi:hypothetical protein